MYDLLIAIDQHYRQSDDCIALRSAIKDLYSERIPDPFMSGDSTRPVEEFYPCVVGKLMTGIPRYATTGDFMSAHEELRLGLSIYTLGTSSKEAWQIWEPLKAGFDCQEILVPSPGISKAVLMRKGFELTDFIKMWELSTVYAVTLN